MLKTAGISMEYIEGLNEEPTPRRAGAGGVGEPPDGEYNHFRRRASVGGPVKKKEKDEDDEGGGARDGGGGSASPSGQEGEPCVPSTAG